MRKAQAVVQPAIERRRIVAGLTEEHELRRAFENELAQARAERRLGKVGEGKP